MVNGYCWCIWRYSYDKILNAVYKTLILACTKHMTQGWGKLNFLTQAKVKTRELSHFLTQWEVGVGYNWISGLSLNS